MTHLSKIKLRQRILNLRKTLKVYVFREFLKETQRIIQKSGNYYSKKLFHVQTLFKVIPHWQVLPPSPWTNHRLHSFRIVHGWTIRYQSIHHSSYLSFFEFPSRISRRMFGICHNSQSLYEDLEWPTDIVWVHHTAANSK